MAGVGHIYSLDPARCAVDQRHGVSRDAECGGHRGQGSRSRPAVHGTLAHLDDQRAIVLAAHGGVADPGRTGMVMRALQCAPRKIGALAGWGHHSGGTPAGRSPVGDAAPGARVPAAVSASDLAGERPGSGEVTVLLSDKPHVRGVLGHDELGVGQHVRS